MTACVEGTKEVTLSLTASTLTTVAVFLPLAFAGGMAGMLFDDFCLTISFLILSSLVIAITLVPLLCYFLLDEEKVRAQQLRAAQKKQTTQRRGLFERMLEGYKKVLGYFVRHLWQGMAASVALVLLFTVTCLNTKAVLMPGMDMGMVSISISTPTGTEVEETAGYAEQVVAIAQENIPELRDLYYTAQAESASVTLNLIDKEERTRSSDDVAADLRPLLQDIAGCQLAITSSDMTAMMTGSDISVDITGTDYETLTMIAQDLAHQIEQLPDAVDVSTSLAKEVEQVQVTMKRDAAAQYGLTAASVGAAVRSELTGSTATTVTIDNEELDVVVRGNGLAATNIDALRSMPIPSNYGGTVPLSSVANVDVVLAPQTITRVDQTRQVSVTGSTISGDTTAMNRQVMALLDRYTLPDGYTAQISGAYTDMMESFGDLLLALVVALGLVYFVLAVFLDTLLICSATAFMCLTSDVTPTAELAGAPYVQAALQDNLGTIGPIFIAASMALFAFTTLIGNYYYCEGCLRYILKRDPSKTFMTGFRLVAAAIVFVGAIASMGLVWNTADLLQGLMVMINIPVIIILAKPAADALTDYQKQRAAGKNPVFKAADINLKEKTEFWN